MGPKRQRAPSPFLVIPTCVGGGGGGETSSSSSSSSAVSCVGVSGFSSQAREGTISSPKPKIPPPVFQAAAVGVAFWSTVGRRKLALPLPWKEKVHTNAARLPFWKTLLSSAGRGEGKFEA